MLDSRTPKLKDPKSLLARMRAVRTARATLYADIAASNPFAEVQSKKKDTEARSRTHQPPLEHMNVMRATRVYDDDGREDIPGNGDGGGGGGGISLERSGPNPQPVCSLRRRLRHSPYQGMRPGLMSCSHVCEEMSWVYARIERLSTGVETANLVSLEDLVSTWTMSTGRWQCGS